MTVLDLGDLSHNRAYGSRCCRDHDCISCFRMPRVKEAEVGSHPRHSENTEVLWQRSGPGIDLHDSLAIAEGVLLHSERPGNMLTDSEARVARGTYDPNPQRPHQLSDSNRRDI